LAIDEPPIMNIYKWLSRKEEIDVGWIHAKPYMYVLLFDVSKLINKITFLQNL
jgi:hypothetical protein